MVTDRMIMDRFKPRRVKSLAVIATIIAVSAAHFAVAVGTEAQHTFHVIFAVLYLLPLIAAAVWFGIPAALAAVAAITIAYYVHIRLAWPNQPMENTEQYAYIAIYWAVAFVTGGLTDMRERELQRHLRTERHAERAAVIEALGGLSNALKARDQRTREHSENVAALACRIAGRMRLSPERVELLRLAALVHDIGKIGVRDDVLLKESSLSTQERTAIEKHAVIAADILRPIHNTGEIAEIVLQHHEAPDGSGYPRGLRAHEILPESSILRVADMFTALTEPRPYKSPMLREEALQFMRPLADVKVDAAAFSALCAELAVAHEGQAGAFATPQTERQN